MSRAGIAVLIGLLSSLLGSGCTPEPPPQIDGGMLVDAMPGSGGLVFRFESDPGVPGQVEDSGETLAYIERAALDLEYVRAIGDAAPGDDHTIAPFFQLDWQEGVEELRFPAAPPGIYSQLLGDVVSYEIEGTIYLEESERRFHIAEVEADIPFATSLGQIELDPGMVREIRVELDLEDLIREIDWQVVPADDDGVLYLNDDSTQIESVRHKIEEGFEREHD